LPFAQKAGSNAIGVTDARWVATGDEFTCAALKSGGAKCWGNDEQGQLGNGVSDGGILTVPVDVLGL
jgi:alpha-tubulin suppressor-like RCC1 family protein